MSRSYHKIRESKNFPLLAGVGNNYYSYCNISAAHYFISFGIVALARGTNSKNYLFYSHADVMTWKRPPDASKVKMPKLQTFLRVFQQFIRVFFNLKVYPSFLYH